MPQKEKLRLNRELMNSLSNVLLVVGIAACFLIIMYQFLVGSNDKLPWNSDRLALQERVNQLVNDLQKLDGSDAEREEQLAKALIEYDALRTAIVGSASGSENEEIISIRYSVADLQDGLASLDERFENSLQALEAALGSEDIQRVLSIPLIRSDMESFFALTKLKVDSIGDRLDNIDADFVAVREDIRMQNGIFLAFVTAIVGALINVVVKSKNAGLPQE